MNDLTRTGLAELDLAEARETSGGTTFVPYLPVEPDPIYQPPVTRPKDPFFKEA